MVNYQALHNLVDNMIKRAPLDQPIVINEVERQIIAHNLTEYAKLVEQLQKVCN